VLREIDFLLKYLMMHLNPVVFLGTGDQLLCIISVIIVNMDYIMSIMTYFLMYWLSTWSLCTGYESNFFRT